MNYCLNDKDYYLKEMDNPHNQYKYQYLDHIETTIDIKENYWEFVTQLFCINDFYLPAGTLVANLQIPYQEVKDISFFFASDQSRAQSAVTYNKKYSHIYESRFNVDVGNNEFFKQSINNTKINCSIGLEIDPQVLESAKVTGLTKESLNGLINETSEQRWDFSMYYTNTQVVYKNEKVENINGYQLGNSHECSSKVSVVNISSNDYKETDESINELCSLTSVTPFQIVSGKVKFHYWLEDEGEEKTVETTLLLDRKMGCYQTVYLNQHTKYDFVNNKVSFNTGGILGFYIPKYSHGYYELELIMNQQNNLITFEIINDFTFSNNINTPHITSSKIRIDSLDGFERIKWNG